MITGDATGGGVDGAVLGVSTANLAKSGLLGVDGDSREEPRGLVARIGVVGGRGGANSASGGDSIGEWAFDETKACWSRTIPTEVSPPARGINHAQPDSSITSERHEGHDASDTGLHTG